MSMFKWFEPKNKKNFVIPQETAVPLNGVELIKAFSTEDEPKCADYPKDKYAVYWEILLKAIPGGYNALVRFYRYDSGVVSETNISRPNLMEVRQDVSALIRNTMEKNKR